MNHDVVLQDHVDPLHCFLSETQVFVELAASNATPRARLQQFLRLLDAAPTTSRANQFIADVILSEGLKQLYLSFGLPAFHISGRCLTLADIRREFANLQVLRHKRSVHYAARLLRLLQERYADSDLTESEIANALGLSLSYLSGLIKRETGQNFCWHLRTIRGEHAAVLLSSTDLTIKEISTACGFRCTGRLDHAFKAIYGMTPTAYRQRQRRVGDFSGDEGLGGDDSDDICPGSFVASLAVVGTESGESEAPCREGSNEAGLRLVEGDSSD